MKCPQCGFLTSNKRDLCPKCTHDLRQAKKALSLPVSYPSATVAELKKLEGGSTSSSNSPKSAASMGAGGKLSPQKIASQKVASRPNNDRPTPKAHHKSKPAPSSRKSTGLFGRLAAIFSHSKTAKDSTKLVQPVRPAVEDSLAPESPLGNSVVTEQQIASSFAAPAPKKQDSGTSVPLVVVGSSFDEDPLPEKDDDLIRITTPATEKILNTSTANSPISFEEEDADLAQILEHSDSAPPQRATPLVAPSVLELCEDDNMLEEQLNKLLDTEPVDFTAVKVPPPPPPDHARAPHISLNQHLVDEDSGEEFEVSFEVEIDDQTEVQPSETEENSQHYNVAEQLGDPLEKDTTLDEQQTADEHNALDELLSVFDSLTADTEEIDIAVAAEPSVTTDLESEQARPEFLAETTAGEIEDTPILGAPELGLEAPVLEELADSSPVIPILLDDISSETHDTIREQNKLVEELLILVSEAYGLDPEAIRKRHAESALHNLNSELDRELEALRAEGTTFYGSIGSEQDPPATEIVPDTTAAVDDGDITSLLELCESELLEIPVEVEPSEAPADDNSSATQDELPAVIEQAEAPEGTTLNVSIQVPPDREELWEQLTTEVAQLQEADSVELSTDELSDWVADDRRTLYFDLVDDELLNPGKRSNIEKTVVAAEHKQIDNRDLKLAFNQYAKTEQVYAAKEAARAANSSTAELFLSTLQPAALWRRGAAFLIDITIATGLGIAGAVVAFVPPEIRRSLLAFESPPVFEVLPFVPIAVGLSLVAWIVLTVFETVGHGRTIGQRFLGISVCDLTGCSPGFARSVLWSSCQLVTWISCGLGTLLGLGRGHQMLHDMLAGVIVTRFFSEQIFDPDSAEGVLSGE